MSKTYEKIFVVVAAAMVIVALFYFPLSNSYLGFLLKSFEEPEWETISPKYIVKNSLLISQIENNGEKCKLSAKGLDGIVEHQFFTQANDFTNKVNYNSNDETIELPCNILPEKESRLHVWYVTQDSPNFPNSYKYYVSPLSETITSTQILEEEEFTDNESIFDEKSDNNTPIENPHVTQILSQCGTDQICGIQSLQELSKTETTEAIFGMVYEILSEYQRMGVDCHGLGHHYGVFLYAQTGNLYDAISLALDRKCSNALTMGIVDNYFKTEVSFEDKTPDELEFTTICKQFGTDPYQLGYGECIHGVGHALLSAYSYDVFPAVKRCDEFKENVEKRLCYEGLFMENTNFESQPVAALDENDLHYPCNQLEEKYAGACYYYQISHILRQKGNVEDALKECNILEKEVNKRFCYLGMGRQISTSFFDNVEGIVPVCRLGLPEYQNFCFQGALIVLNEDSGFEKGFEVCRAFPDSFKQDCYTLMGAWISIAYSDREQMEKECSKAESIEYMEICKSGFGLKNL